MNKISKFLQSKIDAGEFPSAVYLVAEKGEIKLQDALGFAVVEPEKIEAKLETIYDLASLTKVLVTGLLCAKLLEKEWLFLGNDIYESGLQEFSEFKVTIQELLTHTSGFEAWLPFYLLAETIWSNANKELNEKQEEYISKQEVVLSIISQQTVEGSASKKVVYSDLNFLTLGNIVATLFAKKLDTVFFEEVVKPLNLKSTFFNPPKDLLERIAASEKGNAFEKQTCIDLGYFESSANADGTDNNSSANADGTDNSSANADGTDLFRNETIWGEVHDNNCYFMDGVAGHAGLFSNAFEVFKIAQQFLAESTTILKPKTCKLFRTNLTPNMNQARSVAFQLAETEDSTASKALGKDSFGHLGFTGTSLWIEPSTERIFVLLTNRTHNRELPLADLKETRQTFHRLATEILS